MTVLDYFVLIVVVVSVIFGASRGIIKGIISVTSATIRLITAAQVYQLAAHLFVPFTASARAANLLGFVSVFLLVMVAGSLLSRCLRGGMQSARPEWLDDVAAAAF